MTINKIIFSLVLLTTSFTKTFSQQDFYEGNITLIIDDQLITIPIELIFSNETDTLSFDYHLGNKLRIEDSFFKNDNVNISFNYIGGSNDYFTKYKYNFKFLKGWLDNTNYLIIRIYNLNKKNYKKAFCKEESEYVVEVQNQVYSQNLITCKKLKRF